MGHLRNRAATPIQRHVPVGLTPGRAAVLGLGSRAGLDSGYLLSQAGNHTAGLQSPPARSYITAYLPWPLLIGNTGVSIHAAANWSASHKARCGGLKAGY